MFILIVKYNKINLIGDFLLTLLEKSVILCGMKDEIVSQSFLCESSSWRIIIDNCSSFEEAASKALQIDIDSDGESFSIGPVIAVTPLIKLKDEMRLIYSPSVMADIGLHKEASDLIKFIDQND